MESTGRLPKCRLQPLPGIMTHTTRAIPVRRICQKSLLLGKKKTHLWCQVHDLVLFFPPDRGIYTSVYFAVQPFPMCVCGGSWKLSMHDLGDLCFEYRIEDLINVVRRQMQALKFLLCIHISKCCLFIASARRCRYWISHNCHIASENVKTARRSVLLYWFQLTRRSGPGMRCLPEYEEHQRPSIASESNRLSLVSSCFECSRALRAFCQGI